MRLRLPFTTAFAALAVSAVSLSPAFSAGVTKHSYAVNATGARVTGGKGIMTAASATGTITVSSNGQVCYSIKTSGLTGIVEAHIHVGALGTDGADVVTIPIRGLNSKAKMAPCVNTKERVANAILANPAGYYLNVHTSAFPDGAVRGQL
jgi:hypothetical protein